MTPVNNDTMKEQAINYLQQHKKAEPVICSIFGCGKKLTIQEQLFGGKCIQCSKDKPKSKFSAIKYNV